MEQLERDACNKADDKFKSLNAEALQVFIDVMNGADPEVAFNIFVERNRKCLEKSSSVQC